MRIVLAILIFYAEYKTVIVLSYVTQNIYLSESNVRVFLYRVIYGK